MWLRFAFLASVLTPIFHLVVLISSGQDPLATPISALSRSDLGVLHTVGLCLFGSAHIALAIALGGLDRGRLWPYARVCLVLGGLGLFYLAWYFAAASDSVLRGGSANDPLWVVACLTGFSMGALQPGLARQSRRLGLFTVVCLGVWLWMVPVLLFVDDTWLGGYERGVGSVYVIWLAGVTWGLIARSRLRDADRAA